MLHVAPLGFLSFPTGGYVPAGAIWLDGSADYLSWTPSGAADSDTIWTASAWVKRAGLGSLQRVFVAGDVATGNNFDAIYFDANDKLNWQLYRSGLLQGAYTTTAVFRDASAWMHVHVTRSGATVTISVNGEAITAFDTSTAPDAGDQSMFMQSGEPTTISYQPWGGTNRYNGYIAEAIMLDGTASAVSNFGKTDTNGNWVPIDPSGLTFGTNGFWLDFADSADLGNDVSGNGNDFTPTSMSSANATNDNPADDATNGYGNYPTLNPLDPIANVTYTNGNRQQVVDSTVGRISHATIAIPEGKWVYEYSIDDSTDDNTIWGVQKQGDNQATLPGYTADSYGFYSANGKKVNNSTQSAYGTAVNTAGRKMMIAVHRNGTSLKIWAGHDEASAGTIVWQNSGDPANDTGEMFNITISTDDVWFFAGGADGNFAQTTGLVNFGATAFTLDVPSGFSALNTANLPAPDVANYEDEYYIEAGISHTNGSTTAVTLPKSVSGGAMVRIKRTDSTGNWYVVDTVRGANNFLLWNTAATEDTLTFTDAALSGTTLTLPSALATGTYFIEVFYVSEFFQIKTWTGTTAAQTVAWDTALDSFGAIWNKPRSGTGSGIYFQEGNATGDVLFTDNPAAETARANYSQDPDATDFRLEADATAPDLNSNTVTYVAYGWANSGPYRFGSYTGNNDNDGPTVDGGGPPQLIFRKGTSVAQSWTTAVWPVANGNGINKTCYLDTTAAITGGDNVDLISTGFKIRQDSSGTGNNASATYAYGMFGIQPFGGDGVEQARAR